MGAFLLYAYVTYLVNIINWRICRQHCQHQDDNEEIANVVDIYNIDDLDNNDDVDNVDKIDDTFNIEMKAA